MRMFDLLALAAEHRADREREARLERRRPRPEESAVAPAPTAFRDAGVTPSTAPAACPHAAA
jgi:hypothetical protein